MTIESGYCIEDIKIGLSASHEKTLGRDEVDTYADLTGDYNPVHVNPEYAATTMFGECIAHGMLTASLITNVLGTKLPGTGAIYLSQSARFRAPVCVGQTVVVTATVTDMDEKRRQVTLACEAKVGDKLVMDGEARVMVPSRQQG